MRVFLIAMCSMAAMSAPALANTLLVGNKYEGTVSSVDLKSGRETRRVETAGSPHEITLSPEGQTANVVCYLEDGYIGEELSVLDLSTAAHRETISISPHMASHGIAWIDDTRDVIVTTEETRDVIRVNLDERRVTGAAVTDEISVVDVDTMEITHTVVAGNGPEAVDVSPDGSALWVGNNQSKDIFVLDAETLQKQSRIEVGYLPIRVRLHPDGQQVAVADLNGDRIVVYDAQSREEITTIDLAAVGVRTPVSLLFAPDGPSLFVGAQTSGNIAEIDTRSWQLHRVLDAGDGADGLAFSSVGQAVT